MGEKFTKMPTDPEMVVRAECLPSGKCEDGAVSTGNSYSAIAGKSLFR